MCFDEILQDTTNFGQILSINIQFENKLRKNGGEKTMLCLLYENSMVLGIVVTYSQFDSNIRVLYVFLGFLKNTWKYLIIVVFVHCFGSRCKIVSNVFNHLWNQLQARQRPDPKTSVQFYSRYAYAQTG
jgi:hypothetical protein